MADESFAHGNQKHSNEEKAAILAALLAGQRVCEVAQEKGIPESTIRWIRDTQAEEIKRKIREAKSGNLFDMVVDNLEANMSALNAIFAQFQKPEYLEKQSAADLAVAAGIFADKRDIVLRWFGPGDRSGTPAALPSPTVRPVDQD